MINNVLLLLQKTSRYPKAHPLSQCPLVELQGRLCKQFPLHCVMQSLPYIPFLQPVVRNEKLCHVSVFEKRHLIYKRYYANTLLS